MDDPNYFEDTNIPRELQEEFRKLVDNYKLAMSEGNADPGLISEGAVYVIRNISDWAKKAAETDPDNIGWIADDLNVLWLTLLMNPTVAEELVKTEPTAEKPLAVGDLLAEKGFKKQDAAKALQYARDKAAGLMTLWVPDPTNPKKKTKTQVIVPGRKKQLKAVRARRAKETFDQVKNTESYREAQKKYRLRRKERLERLQQTAKGRAATKREVGVPHRQKLPPEQEEEIQTKKVIGEATADALDALDGHERTFLTKLQTLNNIAPNVLSREEYEKEIPIQRHPAFSRRKKQPLTRIEKVPATTSRIDEAINLLTNHKQSIGRLVTRWKERVEYVGGSQEKLETELNNQISNFLLKHTMPELAKYIHPYNKINGQKLPSFTAGLEGDPQTILDKTISRLKMLSKLQAEDRVELKLAKIHHRLTKLAELEKETISRGNGLSRLSLLRNMEKPSPNQMVVKYLSTRNH
jgi:hypothetical protein